VTNDSAPHAPSDLAPATSVQGAGDDANPLPESNFSRLEVEISFVTDTEMTALNARYRGKQRPTDVLSFAQAEGEEFPHEMGAVEAGAFSLGDIVISVDTALRQAVERNHALKDEITFLTVHGTLHLMGYDHANAAGRREMWKWQEEVLVVVRS
jgi:probable rRNA maturation factor